MSASLPLLWLVLTAPSIETDFVQLAPKHREAAPFQRSEKQRRAVVLIHGFKPHPFSSAKVLEPDWHSFQQPDSTLVQLLGKDSDVYAYAYGQNGTLDEIAALPDLGKNIGQLQAMGYRKIVLVGHSAGGLVARQFVEDHPDAGITKVIQVCSPNTGTVWGKATFGIRKNQEALLESLSREARLKVLKERAEKKIPAKVEFACVVGALQVDSENGKTIKVGTWFKIELNGSAATNGDGIVSTDSQWSEDLQRQGIPAFLVSGWHNGVMRNSPGIDKIAELVRTKQVRWNAVQVEEEKTTILNGNKDGK